MLINMAETGHDWEKTNNVTISNGQQSYDTYRCFNCGLEGKRYGFGGMIDVDGRQQSKMYCPNSQQTQIEYVKVISCFAQGAKWSNCVAGSVHKVVSPPDDLKDNPEHQNGIRGYWVIGSTGEPVMLLLNEVVPQ